MSGCTCWWAGGENEVTSFKLTKHNFYSRIPGHLGTAVFIDGDANMNNSRERKRKHPSTGWRATCLSRGRKKDRILQPTSGRGQQRYLVLFHTYCSTFKDVEQHFLGSKLP
jgi:hypothetical protein